MRQDRHLVEDDGRVLHEAAVGLPGIGGQAQDLEAELLEPPAIGRVLGDGPRHVDGLARPEGELACGECGRHVAREGDLPHERICRAARCPLAIAPATVPISSGSVASPAKKSVPSHGRVNARWAGRPPTPT